MRRTHADAASLVSDARFRRAISGLWDRVRLAGELHGGLATPIGGPPLVDDPPPPPFDRKRAIAALEEAGYRDTDADGVRDHLGKAIRMTLLEPAGNRLFNVEARAFALEPRLLLLDEPFSLLDALTRMELQDQLVTLWEQARKTVIMVTHDVDEALLLADRIVMMTSGPAATVREIIDVPFPRPRRREDILTRPDYFWLRDSILGCLEERAAPA